MSSYPSIVETLAEELVVLRAQQAKLKAREADVRDALLSSVAPRTGGVTIAAATAPVRIEIRVDTRFDARRLPDHIRRDPKYQVEKKVTYVRVLKPQRAPKDDFEVIERA